MRGYVLMVGEARQMGVMRSIVPADDEAVICIEPIVGIPLQGVLVILIVDPDRAAVS